MSVEVIFAVSIILLGILIYVSTSLLKKKHYETIDELDSRKKQLQQEIPAEQMKTIDKMMITGQSKEVADSILNDIEDLEVDKLPTIEAYLFEAEQATDRYKLKKASSFQQKADEKLTFTKDKLTDTTKKLKELLQSEEANLKKIESIKKRYHKVRKELLAKSSTFGEAIESLEDRLSVMESLFTSFSDLTASGDHEEAKRVVSQLEIKLNEMETMMNTIPGLNEKIQTVYYEQLDEIREGFQKLSEQNYVFPESVDIVNEIDRVNEKIEKIKGLLSKLKIKEVESEQDEVESSLENLYETMESEIESKYSIEKLLKRLPRVIYYVSNQNKELSLELDRISQSYHLYQGESDLYREMTEALQEQIQLIEEIGEEVEAHSIAYSKAEELLTRAFDQLESLSHSHENLSEDLYEYREKEKEVKEDLEEMEHAIREMKRYVESKHLPGLPEDYLDLFYYTTDHLETLSKELARPKLYLEEVLSIHSLCDEDIEQLAARTEEIVDNALLTELTSQRLYRYREEYPGVMETIKYSENLFLEEYDYSTSLKMVREKLESIEPGAFEDVKIIYNNEKTYS